MELSSAEPSRGSALAKEVDLSASTSHQPAGAKGAGSDAAFGAVVGVRRLQEEPDSESELLSSFEDSSSRGGSLRCLSFLKKLWDVVESDLFESIWWGENKKTIVIDEDLFEEEVLERRGHLRIFHSDTLESFEQELHQHGFFRKLQGVPNSGTAAGELHFYCNKYFELFPNSLMIYEKVLASKTETPLGSPPAAELNPSNRKRKADHQLV